MAGSPKKRARRQAEEEARKRREAGEHLPAIAKARAIVARSQAYRRPSDQPLQIPYLPDATLDEELRKLGADTQPSPNGRLPDDEPIDAEFEAVEDGERIEPQTKRGPHRQEARILTQEEKDNVLDLALHNVPLREIFKRTGVPQRQFLKIINPRSSGYDPAFHEAWKEAKQGAADTAADEMIALADSSLGMDAAGVQAVKLMVDTRKWIAAKLKPRVYGDQVNMRLEAVVETISDSDLDARIASLLAPLKARQAEEASE